MGYYFTQERPATDVTLQRATNCCAAPRPTYSVQENPPCMQHVLAPCDCALPVTYSAATHVGGRRRDRQPKLRSRRLSRPHASPQPGPLMLHLIVDLLVWTSVSCLFFFLLAGWPCSFMLSPMWSLLRSGFLRGTKPTRNRSSLFFRLPLSNVGSRQWERGDGTLV